MSTLEDFVRAETVIDTAPLVPEVHLHLARCSHAIFQSAEQLERPGDRWPPYWAFAWPGGQGLARHLLDHRGLVAGRSVADVGAGSGLAAIAAMQCGAASAVAIDPDPLACIAIGLNASANGATVGVERHDPLGRPPSVDIILIGDLVYEPELETRVTGFLHAALRQGSIVLFADRTTARRPPLTLSLLAEYRAPLSPPMVDDYIEQARVWRIDPNSHTRSIKPRSGQRT
jgi:predicted nicotinamide N-methyase